MSTAKRIRPTGENGAETKVLADDRNGFILPDLADVRSAEDAVSGVYVAVVELANGNHRRHCYFNLPSAEKAVRRANERGCKASIVLCELAPVGVVA